MKNYYGSRSKSRSRFRRSFRKVYKSKYSKRRKFNRIFKSRRAVRPEIKYIDVDSGYLTVNAGSYGSAQLTPATVTNGNNINQKIGNEIRVRGQNLHMVLSCNQIAAKVSSETFVRTIIYTPRTAAADASNHITGLGLLAIPDFNTVTVYKDWVTSLDAIEANLGNTTTNTVISPGSPSERHYKFNLPGYRNLKFPVGNANSWDAEKAIYIYVYADVNSCSFRTYCRTFYTDV